MNPLMLIVLLDGHRLALPAAEVDAVVELEALVPIPRAPAHIAGLSALRSRVLTVIDCRIAAGLPPLPQDGVGEAAVVAIDGHHYALRVDAVEDVLEADGEPRAVIAAIGEGWEALVSGTIDTPQGPVMLLNIPALIAGGQDLRNAA